MCFYKKLGISNLLNTVHFLLNLEIQILIAESKSKNGLRKLHTLLYKLYNTINQSGDGGTNVPSPIFKIALKSYFTS